MFKFENGVRVRDLVTGAEGIITGRAEYLNGCIQYCVKPPQTGEADPPSALWLDEPQLVQTDEGIREEITSNLTQSTAPYAGGPRQDQFPAR